MRAQPIAAAFQVFDQAYLLFWRDQNNVAPEQSLFYAVYLFQQAFQFLHMGFASAMAWLLFVIILAIPAAYALSIRPVRKWTDVMFFFLSTKMLPVVAGLLPLYLFAQNTGLLDNIWLLIVFYTSMNLPIAVWMMRSFLLEVPFEIVEAARVDGAGPFRLFWSIVLPLAVPGLVATFLFVLVFTWNEYLLALFLSSANSQTLPLVIAAQNATRGPQWWNMSVLILIMIVPVIVIAIILERYITRGILIGAVKG